MSLIGFNPLVPPPALPPRPRSVGGRPKFVSTKLAKQIAVTAVRQAQAKSSVSASSTYSKGRKNRLKRFGVSDDVFSDVFNAFVGTRSDFLTWFASAIGLMLYLRFGADLGQLTLSSTLAANPLIKTLFSFKMAFAGLLIMLPSVIDYNPAAFPAASRVNKKLMIVMIVIWCFVVPEASVIYFSVQNFMLRVLMRTRLPSSFILVSSSIAVLWFLTFSASGKSIASDAAGAVINAAKAAQSSVK